MSAVLAEPPPAGRAPSRGAPVVGVLPDGTAYFAPIGEVLVDGSRVTCHLCGRSFRSVAAHLASHGWTKQQYCEAFGLERGQPLEGDETRKLRSAAFSARLVFESALRTGSAAGRDRARAGQLARDAAEAARGRPFPEQRRQRSRTGMSASARDRVARANRERADGRLAEQAAVVARRAGYPDIGQLVLDKLAAGQSLATISLGCGLSRDWLSRHLARLDSAAAATASARATELPDARWSPVLARLGFQDIASYLRERHHVQHLSVNAIAREAGVSFHVVKAALRRHGLDTTPHAAKRHAAEQRSCEVAASLGVGSVAEFVEHARAQGRTWREIAAESGQPQTWLRRHAAGVQADRGARG